MYADALIRIALFSLAGHCPAIPLPRRHKRAVCHRDTLSSLHFSPSLPREMHINYTLSYAAKSSAVNFLIGKARLQLGIVKDT